MIVDPHLSPASNQATAATLLRVAPVLVVDDTPSKRLAMKAALAPLGHRIVEADSGVAALRCIMEEDFAVILLDVTMPGMDGFETARLIRERWQSEMTPIIFVTAFSSDEIKQTDHYAGGAVDFLFAPIPPAELRSKVSFFAHVFINAENLAIRSRGVQETADRLRSLTDAAPIGIFQTDAQNRYVYTNAHWTEITGIPAHEAIGRDWDSIINTELRTKQGDDESESSAMQYHFTIDRVETGPRVVIANTQSMHDSEGTRSGWVGTLADITDLTAAQELLARTAAQQTAVAELGRYALAADDIASVARAAETTITGILGQDAWHARVTWSNEPDSRAVNKKPGPITCVDVGESATISVWSDTGAPLSSDGRQFVGNVANHLDSMLRRAGANVRFEHLATHDPLTELPNRTLFLDRLRQVQKGSERNGHRHAVLFLDLDGFKFVNDGLGHDVGDQLLLSVVKRLSSIMRPSDTLARFGGDEFAILCPNIRNERTALAVGTRIQNALSKPFQLKAMELMATASIGIAIGDASTEGADMLRDADAAMYRAKDSGRNCVALFDEDIQRKAQAHLARATGLRGALENGEIIPHYHPIIELATGRVIGVEALARWRSASGEFIPPDTFIGLAEEIGLIEPLGQHILRTACRDALPWSQSGQTPFMLSVNVSPRQFASGDLARVVLAILKETGFNPSCLLLEITESALMNEPSVQTTIDELRKHGVRFAIDDFGTGYSSLASLRQLPVDYLKIDQSFVSGITTSPQDRALITAAIDLARSFGLKAIAEGVETPEQLRELISLNCELAQGYLWSRPVEAKRVSELVQSIGAKSPEPLRRIHH